MLTGISNAMVADAPPFAELAHDLLKRLDGRVLVAHNARFDYGFLRNEFKRLGLAYSPEVLCTVKLSRRLFPTERSHNLDSVIARHGLSCENRHRALADARVLWDFTRQIHLDLDHSAIRAVVEDLLRGPNLPAALPRDLLDELPESPGVYIFYGENAMPLYVGKSVNIRSRVMAHFASDHRVSKDMQLALQVRRLEHVETAGELGALLSEARLVKQLQPIHNRKLRRNAEVTSLHWNPLDGPQAPVPVSSACLPTLGLQHVYGLFRSKRRALDTLRDLAAEHELCLIQLGVEQGAGPCFAHQLKKCKGVCIGRESELNHAMRVGMALSRLRLEPWPFKGRIGVKEVSRDGERSDVHVLDRWCYLGSYQIEHELLDALAAGTEASFDLDVYQILTRFFNRHRDTLQIIALHSPGP
jgi:DNA polymerase-3 subunit epsilon